MSGLIACDLHGVSVDCDGCTHFDEQTIAREQNQRVGIPVIDPNVRAYVFLEYAPDKPLEPFLGVRVDHIKQPSLQDATRWCGP